MKYIIIILILLMLAVAVVNLRTRLGSTSTKLASPSVSIIKVTPEPTPVVKRESINEKLLYAYYRKYDCPLLPFVPLFISVSLKNGLDWRLLPAIAMRESSCGKHQINNNPFGFGYYRFDSFPSAIEYVGSAISGNNPDEPAYYSAHKSTDRILWIYNGTVKPKYPSEVEKIMEDMSNGNGQMQGM